jgi:hypothetical protein
MKQWAVGAALVALCGAAVAQSVWGQLAASDDSDGLRETLATVGWRGAQGFGLKASTLHYRAPGWGEDGALLGATYQRRDATLQLDASLGLAKLADHDHAVGSLDALWPLARGSSVGLSAERDIVNSVAGIEEGVTFTSLALVADHAFSERFNVGLAAGAALFSNDNQRPLLRTRWNFELAPSYGLNAYLKTRSYQNSDPYRPEYFSPARLNEVSGGLSSRLAVTAGMVLSAALDGGTQHTEGGSKRIWSYALRVGSQRNEAVQWSLALEASNAAGTSLANASEDYRYTRALAQLSVPF